MTIVVAVLSSILQWVLTRLIALGIVQVKKELDENKLEDQAKEDGEALKKAKTDKEREDALRKIIDRTFKP